jgi:hypothetical protein
MAGPSRLRRIRIRAHHRSRFLPSCIGSKALANTSSLQAEASGLGASDEAMLPTRKCKTP